MNSDSKRARSLSAAERPWKPTKAELAAAVGKTVPDVVAPGLDVLFVGINPGLYTAAIGHHFGRPGNRFWPALRDGGFTPRLLTPFEERELLDHGCGVTNIVMRATARADELEHEEFVAGIKALARKVRRYRPKCVAFLGLTAYRAGFGDRKAKIGPRTERWKEALVWVLPNPSGLNAHFQRADFARLFGELREAARETIA
ncbi:MAG: G/U mismatch-specific DNA glycosylase [Planctomycetaceae bacterium]